MLKTNQMYEIDDMINKAKYSRRFIGAIESKRKLTSSEIVKRVKSAESGDYIINLVHNKKRRGVIFGYIGNKWIYIRDIIQDKEKNNEGNSL